MTLKNTAYSVPFSTRLTTLNNFNLRALVKETHLDLVVLVNKALEQYISKEFKKLDENGDEE
jgi:hypothetical protein